MIISEYFQEEEREEAYEKLFALTGYDVHKATVSSGARNVTYIVSDSIKPAVIRVSLAVKERQDILSELLFVDYLRETVSTVCQPIALENNLVNEIIIGDKTYYVVLFRMANGRSPRTQEYSAAMYQMEGEKLGQIHAASKRATREGFQFKRKKFDELDLFDFDHAALSAAYDQEAVAEMKKTRAAVMQIEKTSDNYGLLHGDFYSRNLFIDWDVIWVFDFDDCHYGFYWYDIATLLLATVLDAHSPPELQEQLGWTQEKMKGYYRAFCAGYRKENPCTADFLDVERIMLFIKLRVSSALNVLAVTELPAELRLRYAALLLKVLQSDLSDCF